MKHIVRKIYFDYEKEEKWLNEMSAKGMALTAYSWCRYGFTETLNNEYTYRIQLLENLPTHPESITYIKFLEESGVECVATYMSWIYLRKKSSEGSFDIYSDIESKIKHYRRIWLLFNTVMCIEFSVGATNLVSVILNLNIENQYGYLIGMGNVVAGFLTTLLGIVFLRVSYKIRKKIKKLEKEKRIRE